MVFICNLHCETRECNLNVPLLPEGILNASYSGDPWKIDANLHWPPLWPVSRSHWWPPTMTAFSQLSILFDSTVISATKVFFSFIKASIKLAVNLPWFSQVRPILAWEGGGIPAMPYSKVQQSNSCIFMSLVHTLHATSMTHVSIQGYHTNSLCRHMAL